MAALIAVASTAPVQAQEAGHACALVADAAQRLACYDRAFPLPVHVQQAAAQQAVAEFGLNTAGAPSPGAEEAAPERIESHIATVQHLASGKRVIALDNGQQWQTTEASSAGHMQAGETATLRKGLMGGYLLTTHAGVSLRVRRVR